MKLRIKTNGKSYALDQPCCIDVLDDKGALIAAVVQINADNVQILTPGDPKFDIHAAASRTPVSAATIQHPVSPAILIDRPL